MAQFPLPLQVAGATSAAVAPTAAPPPSAPATDPAPAAAGLSFLSDRPNVEYPLWQMLLYAFIGGLILNVMPCVLPVISLKIMSFVRQSGEDPRRIFSLGLMFGAGVLGSFLVLSLAAIAFKAVVGETAGWGFQLQSPRVVIVLSAVLLALSLSLFGVFSIDLPGAATNKLAGAGGREGYGGAFFNGILATILSTPCSAPFLGTAIGFAMFQPAPVIVLFFLVVGLGLATPYVLLSANPRWLRFLPKPGGWMETFKQVMAFPMLAVLAWLIWVLGGQAGNDSVAMALAFLIAVGFACWLIGRYEYRNTRARRIAVVSALALVIAGYFFFPERHLQAMASLAAAEPAGKAAQAPEEWANGIEWEPFSVAAVERLTADNRTVFLDFTADWCTTCKFFEGTVLNTDRVAELFSRYDVAPVKADWTRRDPVIGQVLAQFGKAGVPLYVILPAGRPEDAIVMDAISADRIEKGLAQAAGEQAVATR